MDYTSKVVFKMRKKAGLLWIFAIALLLAGCGAPQLERDEIEMALTPTDKATPLKPPQGAVLPTLSKKPLSHSTKATK